MTWRPVGRTRGQSFAKTKEMLSREASKRAGDIRHVAKHERKKGERTGRKPAEADMKRAGGPVVAK